MKIRHKIAAMIDHTALGATVMKEDIKQLCEEAIKYSFAAVCVNPVWVSYAATLLKETPHIKVCTVIGFPLGSSTTAVKQFEAKNAVENGATEIDMVMNIAKLKAGQEDEVERDISAVVAATKGLAITKVIIETSELTEEEIVRACYCVKNAGADYVKTSTGFSTGGATVAHVQLMKKTVGPSVNVKASGGIRDLATAKQFVQAGASRLGASAGVVIAEEEQKEYEI